MYSQSERRCSVVEQCKAGDLGKTWDFELLPEKASKKALTEVIRSWMSEHPDHEILDIEYGYGVIPVLGVPQGWYSAMIVYKLPEREC